MKTLEGAKNYINNPEIDEEELSKKLEKFDRIKEKSEEYKKLFDKDFITEIKNKANEGLAQSLEKANIGKSEYSKKIKVVNENLKNLEMKIKEEIARLKQENKVQESIQEISKMSTDEIMARINKSSKKIYGGFLKEIEKKEIVANLHSGSSMNRG